MGTPLVEAASEGALRSLELLVPATADVDAVAESGFTATIAAAARGLPKCVTALCEGGIDVSVQGVLGMTALHFAAGKEGR